MLVSVVSGFTREWSNNSRQCHLKQDNALSRSVLCKTVPFQLLTLSLPSSKSTFSQPFQDKYISDGVRICRIVISHLSRLQKNKLSILCDVIFLVRL